MMELNFIGCKTREDVEKVFEKERERLGNDIRSIDMVKELFFDGKKEFVTKERFQRMCECGCVIKGINPSTLEGNFESHRRGRRHREAMEKFKTKSGETS